ncbi:MAG: 4-alpha-glucanotransferase [Ruminiclostridium sp.]|nr:4-alpha-glucanotransferase [Ruminiclostridium sp.]
MRSCGILMHITSLPSPYGIGTFGNEAERFADWLKSAGQSYWQVLPLGPTGYGDSPYQSFSAFAGNPLLIDLDDLVQQGLITRESCTAADYGADPSFVDFEKVTRTKMALLNEAFKHFNEDVGYLSFAKDEAMWLEDYALFMSIKEANDNRPFWEWEKKLCNREPDAMKKAQEQYVERVGFWKFVQYVFYTQLTKLRRYCNRNGIKLIGDMPFYVARDSADVWAHPDIFQLQSAGVPSAVAGVPPDYFSATGQLWGNPLYDWHTMKKEDYVWWIERLRKSLEMYDVLRIDHFRAFDTYCSIPAADTTAVNGKWMQGPGMDFWNEVKKRLGEPNIIAEDLGEVFDSVKQLLADTGFPGMRVMQFGFNPKNEDNDHLPHNYVPNSVAYTGTHDNDTFMGWAKENKAAAAVAKKYCRAKCFFAPLNKAVIKTLYGSPSELAIVPMQDVIGLDSKARMNTPSVLGGNWKWRVLHKQITPKAADWLCDMAKTYCRK